MINKKGTIGTTLTWIPAFLIIFFIMFLFISITSVLAGKKAIPLFGEGFSSIDVLQESTPLLNQRQLFMILNTPTEDGTIKDLIVSKDEDKIKKHVNRILDSGDRDCYFFELKYSSGGEISLRRGFNMYGIGPTAVSLGQDRDNLPGTKYEEDLFFEGEKVNVFLYTEKC